MNIKTMIVAGSALVVSATLTMQAQQAQPQHDADYMINYTPIQGRVVKGMPYSAEIVSESVQTLGDGNRIVHRSTGRIYRDAEGRVRREEDRGNTATITISDSVANKSYTLDPANRTAREAPGLRLVTRQPEGQKTTVPEFVFKPSPAGAAGARGGRGSTTGTFSASGRGSQVNVNTITTGRGGRGAGRGTGRGGNEAPVEEQLANRNIEGVSASGIRRTTTIPQGAIGNEQPIKIVSEEWTSVDLQVLVLTDVNDPRSGRSTYKLLNIKRDHPDPALFKVPSDYTLHPMGGRGRGSVPRRP